jgi:cytoskeletal protein CcmA (bactofilin family)
MRDRRRSSANGSAGRSGSIIGTGVRIEGDIAFSGFLRVMGDIVGNVSCDSDSQGTTVIHGSGSITGTIKTPHIVVGGRVNGPLDASESIEIQEDAHVVGNARYKQIAIHAGGIIEGVLTSAASVDETQSGPERGVDLSAPLAGKKFDLPSTNEGILPKRSRGGRKLIAAIVIVAIGAVVWLGRQPTTVIAPAAVAVAPGPDVAVKETPAPRSAPLVSDELPGGAKTPSGVAALVVPDAHVAEKAVVPAVSVAPTPPRDQPKVDANKVVMVQGMELDKPADLFFVDAKTPSVLFKKQRSDPGDGTRIELSQGVRKRISISENEIVRAVPGGRVDLFYQGRKVSPRTVESGTWMGFAPLSPSGASETR